MYHSIHRARRITAAILILFLAANAVTGQVVEGDRYYTIEDSQIILNGTFEGLAGIEAISGGGFLSLDFVEIPGFGEFDLRSPFPATAVVVDNSAHSVVIGVLGSDNRIDFSGRTATAIGYSASLQVAAEGDLTVNLGLGDLGPAELLPVGGQIAGEYYASIVDGHLALHTSSPLNAVGGIYVESASSSLELGDAKLPFAADAAVHLDTPNAIKFGVENPSKRIRIAGQTITSIAYSGLEADAASDLRVELGLVQCATGAAVLPIGIENALDRLQCTDEPSTSFGGPGTLPKRLYASVVDGQLAFHGSIPALAGVYVHSNEPALSLGDAKLPFDTDAFVNTNTAQEIKFGVADISKRISLEGQTITSIGYSGSAATARDQLTIALGLGECGAHPANLPIGVDNAVSSFTCDASDAVTSFTTLGGVPGNGTVGGGGIYATVADGHLVLNGSMANLAGIEVSSAGRHLSLETTDVAGQRFSHSPFPATAVERSRSNGRISLGVINADDRISVEGVTTTAIQYSQSIITAKSDLSVDVLLEECGSTLATLPVGIDSAVDQLVCDGGSTGSNLGLPDFVKIENGAIVIQGEFNNVREIEATSRGGHLSLESTEVDGQVAVFNRPFNQSNGVSIYSTPGRVELQVLNNDDRISIDGNTVTSILYSESQDIGAFDLDVSLVHQPIGGGGVNIPGLEFVSVVDGRITINGTFEQLAGIEVHSAGGFLSLDRVDVPGVGEIVLKGPFPATASVVDNSSDSVVLGVLGAENRIDISGETQTSILYTGPPELFLSDITINLGLGDDAPASFPLIPEPSSALLMLFGLGALLARPKR